MVITLKRKLYLLTYASVVPNPLLAGGEKIRVEREGEDEDEDKDGQKGTENEEKREVKLGRESPGGKG